MHINALSKFAYSLSCATFFCSFSVQCIVNIFRRYTNIALRDVWYLKEILCWLFEVVVECSGFVHFIAFFLRLRYVLDLQLQFLYDDITP